jgi:hypothetical protein
MTTKISGWLTRKPNRKLLDQYKQVLMQRMMMLAHLEEKQRRAYKAYKMAEAGYGPWEVIQQIDEECKQAYEQVEQMKLACLQAQQVVLALEQESERLGLSRQLLVEHPSPVRETTIITGLSRFLSERARAEWVGDLYEMRAIWHEQELSSWIIHIRTVGVALQLLAAQLRCTAYDRVFTQFWKKS